MVVAQGEAAERDFGPWPDRVLRRREKLGFAAANNLGFAATSRRLRGHDQRRRGGGARVLRQAGRAARRGSRRGGRAGAQPAIRRSRAYRRRRHRLEPAGGRRCRSASVRRRRPGRRRRSKFSALRRPRSSTAAARSPRLRWRVAQVFAERLFIYYEDVELAVRLRQAGWSAWLEPRARATHAGSASLSTLPFSGRDADPRQSAAGGGEPARWRILAEAAADPAARSPRPRTPAPARRFRRSLGVLLGCGRGVRLLPAFARSGAPAWPLARLALSERPRGYAESPGQPLLCGVVVHWKNEEELAELVDAWPKDERCELLVVDNSGTAAGRSAGSLARQGAAAAAGGNRGFGGGVNAGVAATGAPWVLILNPDAKAAAGRDRKAARSRRKRKIRRRPGARPRMAGRLEPMPLAAPAPADCGDAARPDLLLRRPARARRRAARRNA